MPTRPIRSALTRRLLGAGAVLMAAATAYATYSVASRQSSRCEAGKTYVFRVIGGWEKTPPSNPYGQCVSDESLKRDLVEKPTWLTTIKRAALSAFRIEKAWAAPTPYYVAMNGSDSNPGTEAQPFKTIVKGIDRLSPGDTLIIGPGNYDEIFYMNGDKSGTSWATATHVKAKERGTVTVRGFSLGVTSSPAEYIDIDGLVVDGRDHPDNGAGINHGGHIRLQNTEIKNVHWSGAWGGCGGFDHSVGAACEYINLKIHNVAWPQGQNRCDYGSSPDGYCHGIYDSGDSVLIEGSEFYNIGGFGLHLRLSPNNMTVRNNLIHDNGGDDGGGGIIETSGGNLYYNNIVYNNGGWGGITLARSRAYNNTVYANRAGFVMGYQGMSSGNEVKNNIIYGNREAAIEDNTGGGNTIESNLLDDPRFVNAGAGDFHLQAGSDAIDKGMAISEVTTDYEGTPRPQGMRYDIGAYEYRAALPAADAGPADTGSADAPAESGVPDSQAQPDAGDTKLADAGGAGGNGGAGGGGGSGGAAGAGGRDGGAPAGEGSSGGCGCRLSGHGHRGFGLAFLGLALTSLIGRRRARPAGAS